MLNQSKKNNDKEIYEIGKDLHTLFHQKEWESLIKIEEKIKSMFEKRRLKLSYKDERFKEDSIYLKGCYDAIITLWSERQVVLGKLKEKEGDEDVRRK